MAAADVIHLIPTRYRLAQEFCERLRVNRTGQPCLLRQHGNTVEAGPVTVRFTNRGAKVVFADPWDSTGDEIVTIAISGSWSFDTLALLVEGLLAQLAVTP